MIKDLIKSAPDWLQKLIKNMLGMIPYEQRLGNVYRNMYNFLQKSQWWSEEEHECYQMKELEKLLNHAYENVPYYRDVFDERGLKPQDIKKPEDLKKLPYLTKEIVQNNLDRLTAENYDAKKLKYLTTGGSTGVPLGFYHDKETYFETEWAFMTSQWARVGYDIKKRNKRVVLRGIVPDNNMFQYDGQNLILSSYNLVEDTMKKYIDLIEDFNPEFIHAYPSSIAILSDYLLNCGHELKCDKLKAILCGSENIYDFQREQIEKAFGKRVYSWYGQTEQCSLAGECEESNYYHIFSEYGYVEIINEDGEYVSKEDEIGELVCTSLHNYAVPFIRYKTGDLAINTNEKCACGRNYKLIKRILGREQEQIVTKTGAKVAMTSIIFAQHFNAFSKMANMQLEQNDAGEVIVRIQQKEAFTPEDVLEIKQKMSNATDNQLDIEVEFVDEIKRTKSGKHKFLIQNIDVSKNIS